MNNLYFFQFVLLLDLIELMEDEDNSTEIDDLY